MIRFEDTGKSFRRTRVLQDIRLGIEQGDRVGLLMPNIPEFAFAYFGIQKIGAVAVSLNVMLKTREVEMQGML